MRVLANPLKLSNRKIFNLADCEIIDYLDKDLFIEAVAEGKFDGKIEAIFHQGACSTTTEWDGRYMMNNNYQYSKTLLHFCFNEIKNLSSRPLTRAKYMM